MDSPASITNRLTTYLLVAVAGAAGALFRYAIELSAIATPSATLLANVIGCVGLGGLSAAVAPQSRRYRAVIGGGFLGAVTTYSGIALIAAEATPVLAAGYLVVTYALGFAAILVGYEAVARWWYR